MTIRLNSAIIDMIDDDTLRTDIAVALRPTQLFRALVTTRETWDARVGDTATFTRNGYLPVSTKKRTAGVDPTPQNKASFEQWSVTCYAYNDTIDTNLPNSYQTIQNEVMRDARTMMIQAGTTLAHLVRNKMYNTYLGGNTRISATATSVTQAVDALAGFHQTINSAGRLADVSPANPIAATMGSTAVSITAVTPTDATQPDGPGTVTLSASTASTAGDKLIATKRPIVYRVGAGATANAIVTGNKVTFTDFRNVVALLRTNNIHTFPDGTYHCQIDPTTETQLFADTDFKQLLTGVPESSEWREFAIGKAAGITFFRNNEVPNSLNTSADDYVAGTFTSDSGVEIHRPIVYGPNTMMEKYVPLDQMYAEASAAVGAGDMVIGDFNVAQDQSVADLVMDGIKLLIRGPQDRLAENVSQTWSYKGDFVCPCDSLTGTAAIYKRAMIVEHAG